LTELFFQPIDEPGVRAIARWRYEPPYDIYSLDGEDGQELVQAFLHPAYHYYRTLFSYARPGWNACGE